MPENILVVAEQHAGKLNRVSWETLTGAQGIAAQTGWLIEAAVLGQNIGAVAQEIARAKIAKVYALESQALANYTPDAFVAALQQFIGEKKPRLVLMPHTYRVRDFAPQLVAALGRTVVDVNA